MRGWVVLVAIIDPQGSIIDPQGSRGAFTPMGTEPFLKGRVKKSHCDRPNTGCYVQMFI